MHNVDLFQLKLKNGPFACRSFGQGEPLLFLHAGICDARMWKPQVDYFSKRYQVILCDLRGFGRSPLPGHRFAHHEDIAGLLDVLRLPAVTLIGASFGGQVAIDFALTYPARVKRLILVTPAISGFEPDAELEAYNAKEDALLEAGRLREAARFNVDFWVVGEMRRRAEVDADLMRRVEEMQFDAFNNPLPAGVGIKRLDPPALERLDEIKVPALILSGALDRPSFIGLALRLARRLSHGKHIVMDQTAHLPSLERPEMFNQIVADDLAGE